VARRKPAECEWHERKSLMARDVERQVAERHIRTAVLNAYSALGIPVTEPTG
jgi:hypothetical protein